ncbi:MAG TPA: hypothetical protein VJT81_06560 [Burkholderiales bacterium]|nr:hypothetical protein [Burkholderiales bacterium]
MAAEDKRPFNCSRCTWGRHCDESRPAPFKQWHFTYQGETVFHSRTCPLPLITAASNSLVRLYRHYKAGRYPFGGGLLEQPNAYIEAMEVIESVSAEIESAQLAKRQAQS